MTGVGIVTALRIEARALGADSIRRGAGPRAGTISAVSGVGCAAAGAAARSLVDAGATALMSFGLAGGLDPSLRVGAVILPIEVISFDGARFPTSSEWREQLTSAVGAEGPVVVGKLLTSAHAIETVAGKARAFRDTGAIAVDMESLAIAAIAAIHRLPFMVVRVIVDTAADELPRAVVAAAGGGEVRLWRLIGGLLRSPLELPALIRLARRYRVASASLGMIARIPALAAPLPTARVA